MDATSRAVCRDAIYRVLGIYAAVPQNRVLGIYATVPQNRVLGIYAV